MIPWKRELFEQLRLLIENRFGPSTEKYKVSDNDETPEDQAETPIKPASAKPRTRGGRLALPPELPRVDIVHDVADDQKHCHNDGGACQHSWRV